MAFLQLTCDSNVSLFVLSTVPRFQEVRIMFNVLNSFIARLDADSAAKTSTQSSGDNSYGFQVLRNTNKDLPIEPWFDFIIGINGHFIVRIETSRTTTQLLIITRRILIPTSLQPKSTIAPDPLSPWTFGAQRYCQLRNFVHCGS